VPAPPKEQRVQEFPRAWFSGPYDLDLAAMFKLFERVELLGA